MALEYIGQMLEDAVDEVSSLEIRGRVDQVVGTIIRASVPGVKVGELCILRNPGENWMLRAEVVGFSKNTALLTPLGDLEGISYHTEVIPTGHVLSVPVGEELLGRVLNGVGDVADGGPALKTHKFYPVYADPPAAMQRKLIEKGIPENEIAIKLIEYANVPLATSSANISGEASGINLKNIMKDFNDDIDYYIDGGFSKIGIASTVVQVFDGIPHILRKGVITIDDIKKVVE